ncbi:serine/threonine-protein kinase [Asanoa sp. NPDC050611]|uniref:serine/threonine protein kinase n=1 Tax=Asanoa sp. NPDC050611 TaxID=3157098 RepID=UPI003408CD36
MAGNHAPRGWPLRDGDVRRLGRYTIVGRLGEGGMGTVYLAHTPDGVPVAVKVIRTDLAHDDQFRRRFRSEVSRARQVPPFCTAEVLDADVDHEMPYLVVEYVDGPSLATVVSERGPLSQSNLHGLAIGVATALTAIHGAGVIHRDLKPNNVLLAAGSPKVIDFGIAHSPQATAGHTRTDQVVGTVGYMAPERFEPATGVSVTPAADIFSWGAVIAFAGTGRNPFGSDQAPIVAARILTQPPELAGLSGLLRELVEQSLAKNPDNRPTARGLLDRLLTTGASRSSDLAAAFARQPALRAAAEEAVQATVGDGDATAVRLRSETTAVNAAGSAATTRFEQRVDPRTRPPVAGPPARASGGRWSRFAVVVIAVAALVTSLTVAGVVYGVIPRSDRGAASQSPTPGSAIVPPASTSSPSASASVSAPASAAASASVSPGPAGQVVIADALTAPGVWPARDDPDNHASCRFDGAFVVARETVGSYRCPGLQDVLTDFSVAVDVKLRTPGSCAAIWFRFDSAGPVLRICAEAYYLAAHGATITPLRTFQLAEPTALNTTIRVGITASGTDLTFSRDGRPVGEWKATSLESGRVVLGIFQDGQTDTPPPFEVAFANIEIRTLAG